jgi:general stress protein YciG
VEREREREREREGGREGEGEREREREGEGGREGGRERGVVDFFGGGLMLREVEDSKTKPCDVCDFLYMK